MDLIKKNYMDVRRGDMLPGWGGVVIADTLSGDESGPYWINTDTKRHYPDTQGQMSVYVPTIRTQETGQDRDGLVHILLLSTPGGGLRAPCGYRGTLTAWESGTALAGVSCQGCRDLYNLVGRYTR